MSQLRKCLLYAGTSAAIGGAIFGIFMMARWMASTSQHADAEAAWTQALGSILAIGFAVWVPARQFRQQAVRQEQIRNEQQLSRLVLIRRMLAESLRYLRCLKKAARSLNSPDQFSPRLEQCRDLILRLANVPIEHVPERYMVYVFDLRSMLFEIVFRFEVYEREAKFISDEDIRWLTKQEENVDKLNKRAEVFYDATCNVLGVAQEKRWPLVWAHGLGTGIAEDAHMHVKDRRTTPTYHRDVANGKRRAAHRNANRRT